MFTNNNNNNSKSDTKLNFITVPASWTVNKLHMMEMGFFNETDDKEAILPKLSYHLFEILVKYEFQEEGYDTEKQTTWVNPKTGDEFKRALYSEDVGWTYRHKEQGLLDSVWNPSYRSMKKVSFHYGCPLTMNMIKTMLKERYKEEYFKKTLVSSNIEKRLSELRHCFRGVTIQWFYLKDLPLKFFVLADDGMGKGGKLDYPLGYDTLSSVFETYPPEIKRMFHYLHLNKNKLELNSQQDAESIVGENQ